MSMSLCDYKIHTDQVKHPYKYRVVFTIDCDYEELVQLSTSIMSEENLI